MVAIVLLGIEAKVLQQHVALKLSDIDSNNEVPIQKAWTTVVHKVAQRFESTESETLKQCQHEKKLDAVALTTCQEEATKQFDTITVMQKEMIEAESLITELNDRMLNLQTENNKIMKENVKIVREKDMVETERDQIELSRTHCETNTASTKIERPIDFTFTIATAVVGGILALLLAITLVREVIEKNHIAAKLSELENLPKTRYVPTVQSSV